jgi:hypothetical protein
VRDLQEADLLGGFVNEDVLEVAEILARLVSDHPTPDILVWVGEGESALA